jgi:hypothetical protein
MTAKGATRDTATTQPVLPASDRAHYRVLSPTGFIELFGRELAFRNGFGFRFKSKGRILGADEEQMVRTCAFVVWWIFFSPNYPTRSALLPPRALEALARAECAGTLATASDGPHKK